MKNLVAKSTESGNIDSDEFCEGLLKWLNTSQGHGLSSAEVLYGSPLRSIIPAAFHAYAKYWKDKFEKWDETMSTLKRGEEEYYNKLAKPLTPLRIGRKVRIQDPITKKWDRCGDIIGIEKHRDYHVRLPSGRVYWRNRRFVIPAVINELDEEHNCNNINDSNAPPERRVRFNKDTQTRPHFS